MEIIKTETFKKDFEKIKDFQIRFIIEQRIDRVKQNNLGDYKNLKDGLYELRFLKLGIRIYFTKYKGVIILLLKAGDKKNQQKDIEKCRAILKEI
jgi:putative addiction module killer protein